MKMKHFTVLKYSILFLHLWNTNDASETASSMWGRCCWWHMGMHKYRMLLSSCPCEWQTASTGTSCDILHAHGHNKRDTLL